MRFCAMKGSLKEQACKLAVAAEREALRDEGSLKE